MSTVMSRRAFFGRVFALAAAAFLLRYVGLRSFSPTWTLQAMLDAGVPIPPGMYTLSRPLVVRRDDTTIADVTLSCDGDFPAVEVERIRGMTLANFHIRETRRGFQQRAAREFGAPSYGAIYVHGPADFTWEVAS